MIASRVLNSIKLSHVLGMLAQLLLSQAILAQSDSFFVPLEIDRPITFYVSGGDASSGYEPDDDTLVEWALNDWARALDGRLQFTRVAEPADALIQVHFVGPGAGQYGQMQPLMVNGHRGAEVFIRPDTSSLGPVIGQRATADKLFRDAIVYLTCVHELGHALALAHTAEYADIMYAFGFGGDIVEYFDRYRRRLQSREDIKTTSVLSPNDISRLRALYP